MIPIRRKWLLMKATRTARRSVAISKKSQQLSESSTRYSKISVKYLEAARQAEKSGSFFSWMCLRFYSWLMLNGAAWFLGRAQQLGKRAEIKLLKAEAILESLGIKHKPQDIAEPNVKKI